MTSIQLEWWKLKESERHNLAMESQAKSELHEATRHNVASEAIGRAQAGAAQWQARIAELRAGIEQDYLAIAQRKVPYETSLLGAQTELNLANARLAEENAAYTRAKSTYQNMQNSVYALYGEVQARATYHGTVANTWNTWVDTVSKGVKTVDTAIKLVGSRVMGPISTLS